MKKFLLLSMLLISAVASNAQNYVVAGTEWITRYYVLSGNGESYLQYCTLQESSNPDAPGLELWRSYENESSEPVLIAYIKSEDEKVWCMKPDMSEWFLMYDFGMQTGNSETFYSVWAANNEMVQSTMECVGIVENNPEFQGFTSMKMVDEGEEVSYSDYWLKGIGSLKGFIYNNWFGSVAGDVIHVLVEVRHNGEVIYSNPAGVENIETDASSVKSSDPLASVYDLTGRVVGKQTDMKALPSGIYISNGKKILK